MKKIFLYVMALVAVFSLAACSTDDSPQLSGVESGELTLDAGAIDGKSTKYTFTWTSASFYIDGDMQKAVSLVGYEKNGIDYHLMGVETGHDMKDAVDFGSVVSKNFLTLDYEKDLVKKATEKLGMTRSTEEDYVTSIDFQLIAKYASPDTCVVKSKIVTIPFTLTMGAPEDEPGEPARLFICDDTDDWTKAYLYAWGNGLSDANDLFGGWPGEEATATTAIGTDGKTYYEFKLTEACYGNDINLIIHNETEENENRRVLYTVDFGKLKEDLYIRVSGNVTDGYNLEIVKAPGKKLYICNQAGWEKVQLYGWGDGLSDANDLFGGWPGEETNGNKVTASDGNEYEEFPLTTAAYENLVHYIAHNPVEENENRRVLFDLNMGEQKADVYIVITGNDVDGYAWHYAERPPAKLYICNQAGWEKVQLYGWGDGLSDANDLFGGWPGEETNGNKVTASDGNEYEEFPLTTAAYENLVHYIAHNPVEENENRRVLFDLNMGEEKKNVYVLITGDDIDGYETKIFRE